MKFIKQHDSKDCGAACFNMICEHYGLKISLSKAREILKVDNLGVNLIQLEEGAKKVGFDAESYEECEIKHIESKELFMPFIARIITDKGFPHYVVVYKINSDKIFIVDPAEGHKKFKKNEFVKIWMDGIAVTFEKTKDFEEKNERKNTIKKFFNLILLQKKYLILLFFISGLTSTISLLGTQMFKVIIDGQINKTDNFWRNTNISNVFLIMSGLYIFSFCFQVLRGYALTRFSKNVDISIVLGYYNHLINLPMDFFARIKTGELMSRFSDAAILREALSGVVMTIMLDSVLVVLGVFILAFQNSFLSILALVVAICYGFIVFLFKKRIKKISEEMMKSNSELFSYLKESIDSVETIKSFSAEKRVKNELKSRFINFLNKNISGMLTFNLQGSLSMLASSLGILMVLWFGLQAVFNNQLTLGELMSFYAVLMYFLNPVKNIIDLQPKIQTAIVAANRLNDILELSLEQNSGQKLQKFGIIEIKNLDFKYGSQNLVINNFNLKIELGQKIALIGESGCGKTTFAKLLMNFYTPENGSITINGQNIKNIKINELRSKISYISQNVFLFSDTIKNNLLLANPNATDEEIKRVCKLSLAHEFIEQMPMGYNTTLEENGENLSAGQKQRLCIARALLRNPNLIIMDEATSNLDVITEESIKKVINNFNKNITCIIIAHRFSTIENCDRIFIMKNGTIEKEVTYEELTNKKRMAKLLAVST